MIDLSSLHKPADRFQLALKKLLAKRPHGSQSLLALAADISPQYFGRILSGQRHGSEKTRRAIAAALGYPGPLYEEFLQLSQLSSKEQIVQVVEEARLSLEQEEALRAFKLLLLRGGSKAEALRAMVMALLEEN